MNCYAVLCSTNYEEGNNACCYGVYPNREKSIEALRKTVISFYTNFNDDWNETDDFGQWIDDHFVNDDGSKWSVEQEGVYTEFYVEPTEFFED